MTNLSKWILRTAVAVTTLMAAAGSYAADKTEVTVGFALSQTGKASTDALDVQRSYEMWRDQVNADGGLYVQKYGKKLPIKFVAYDDQSDPSSAVKQYERLITVDNVDLLLSPWGSGTNFAVTAVTDKHHYNLVLTSASSDGIYSRGFKYIFLASELASHDAVPLANFLEANKDKIKTVAILYENIIFSETIKDAFLKLIDGKGFNVVMIEKHAPGSQSFAGVLTRVKAYNPDAVIEFGMPPDTIYMTRQMAEVGLDPKFYYDLTGPMFQEFRESLGTRADGVFEHGFWHPSLPYPGAKEFAAAFKARYNRAPSTDAAHAWMATQILGQAVAKAGSLDQEELNKVLHGDQFMTIGGTFKYDETGSNVAENQFLIQMQGGERTIIWPPELAQAKPQWKTN